MSAPINGFLMELCQSKSVDLSAIVSDNAHSLRKASLGHDTITSAAFVLRLDGVQTNLRRGKPYDMRKIAMTPSVSESRWNADGKNPLPTSAPRMPSRNTHLLSPIASATCSIKTCASQRKNACVERTKLSLSCLL